MTTITNEEFKNLNEEAMLEWLENYVAELDTRDPMYDVFKIQLARNKESAEKLKATQLELEETNEKLKKGLKSYINHFVSFEDEETIPYLIEEKYKDNLMDLSTMIQEVESKFIDLHCKVYGFTDFENVYMDNISCCADYYFENYNKFEETKGINSFIGAVTYISMLHKADDISDERLVELCIGLFKDHDPHEDSCFAWVTDGSEYVKIDDATNDKDEKEIKVEIDMDETQLHLVSVSPDVTDFFLFDYSSSAKGEQVVHMDWFDDEYLLQISDGIQTYLALKNK